MQWLLVRVARAFKGREVFIFAISVRFFLNQIFLSGLNYTLLPVI